MLLRFRDEVDVPAARALIASRIQPSAASSKPGDGTASDSSECGKGESPRSSDIPSSGARWEPPTGLGDAPWHFLGPSQFHYRAMLLALGGLTAAAHQKVDPLRGGAGSRLIDKWLLAGRTFGRPPPTVPTRGCRTSAFRTIHVAPAGVNLLNTRRVPL